MNPITTHTIPANPAPAIILVQHEHDGPITYASFGLDTPAAVDMLRRALIHLVAELHQVATVPSSAVILFNGHSPEPVPDSSRVLVAAQPGDVPPLRVPKAKPTSAPPTRGKPGPKPGTRRRSDNDVRDAPELAHLEDGDW